jgi:2-aminoadipate transaminase
MQGGTACSNGGDRKARGIARKGAAVSAISQSSVFARRAAGLATNFPAPHFPTELEPGTIAFDSGFAFSGLLPDLTAFAHDALTTHRAECLQYSANQGQPELRNWIAQYMNADGCALSPEEIIVVNGAKHGIELICKMLLNEGDAVVVTAPTYFSAIPIFGSFGAELIEVGQDDDGLRVDQLEAIVVKREQSGKRAPKIVYNVADFHNPTGLSMSRARREALIALAARAGMMIVEDNPYRRVRFEGSDVPTLKALDRDGVVLHAGTFSKLIAPGLRIGWIAARRDLIVRLIQLKADGGSSALMQRIVYEFCNSPAFTTHVERVRHTYGAHRDRMVMALRRHLPEISLTVPEGGYYVWLRLPDGMSGDVFAAAAAKARVNVLAGSKFFPGGANYPRNAASGRDRVRLSYSFATLEQIDEGVERLAIVYASMAGA